MFQFKTIVAYSVRFDLFILLAIPSLAYGGDTPMTSSIEKLMPQRSAQAYKGKLVDHYESVFGGASLKQLVELKQHSNAGISLRAAWERVRRTMSEEQSAPSKKIDARALERFIGFLDGRLRLDVPAFWVHDLLDSRYSAPRILFTGKPRWKDLESPASDGASIDIGGVLVNSTHDIAMDCGKTNLVVTLNHITYAIPIAILRKSADLLGNRVLLDAVSAGNQKLIVALHSSFGEPYRIYCIDCRNRRTIWESEVWCESPLFGGASGIHLHKVALVLQGGVVYVFGMCTHSAYVEAFSIDSGANTFRFSTSY